MSAPEATEPAEGAVPFDLNVKKVLEHWPVSYAVRELIANALDEHVLTGTPEPAIVRDGEGVWRIVDFGRGLRPEHLLQHESTEKTRHPDTIGQFGIGLKDALAVLERRGIRVGLRSAWADILTGRRPKAGFPDIVTLHGLIAPPSDPARVGTEVTLEGLGDPDMAEAREFFLRYTGGTVLEATRHGEILARPPAPAPARIYVRGVFVAEEPNFLFSYNITNVTPFVRRALNRERMHVGRRAYEARMGAILQECVSEEVLGPLGADLAGFQSGTMHDELKQVPVAVLAAQVLQPRAKVIFVTTPQLNVSYVQFAAIDGYRAVVVAQDVAAALVDVVDGEGNPMRDLEAYRREWDASFSYDFVDPAELTPAERRVWELKDHLIALVGMDPARQGITEILLSNTTRLNTDGYPVYGQCEFKEHRIVIRRDRLADPALFCGTLLHELCHAESGKPDGTLGFEDELTYVLGKVAGSVVAPDVRSGR